MKRKSFKNFFGFYKWLFSIAVILLTFSLNGFAQPNDPSLNAADLESLKNAKARYLKIQNGHLEYYRFGKGEPIVLIEGYATDVTSWNRRFLAALAKEHEVIVFNNRNIGGSRVQSSQYECKNLARDTYQLIQQLHLKKPTILGISMGGMIAQQFAVLYPQDISKLILINTAIAGSKAKPPDPTIQKLMLKIPKNNFDRYVSAVRLFIPPTWIIHMGVAFMQDRFQPKHYAELIPSAKTLIQQQRLVKHWMRDNQTGKQISELNLPTLILNGDADIVIPPINSDILAEKIRHSYLLRFKDGGHAMTYQFPQEIANAVNVFMKRDQNE